MDNNNKPEISKVHEAEVLEHGLNRLLEIRFECLVTAFDTGTRMTKGDFLQPPKPYPPQWFKLKQHFSLEFIKRSDPYEIGVAIKKAFENLEMNIDRYEKWEGV